MPAQKNEEVLSCPSNLNCDGCGAPGATWNPHSRAWQCSECNEIESALAIPPPTREDALDALRRQMRHARICVYCGWGASRSIRWRGGWVDFCGVCATVRAMALYARKPAMGCYEEWLAYLKEEHNNHPDGEEIRAATAEEDSVWQVGEVFTCECCGALAPMPELVGTRCEPCQDADCQRKVNVCLGSEGYALRGTGPCRARKRQAKAAS